jgi:hypothetical protein
MPDTVITNDGGLGAPAKRGRPRKIESSGSPGNGSQESAGGNAEPVSGVEGPASSGPNGGGFTPIDPIAITAAGGDDNGDQPRRGRGRPKGSRKAAKEETVQNLSALLKIERLLVTSCFFMGNLLSAPELHIDEAEAAEIGEALKELSKHYPIGMSEKTIAWVNFSFAVGGVFGPKIQAIYKRPKPKRPQLEPTPIRTAAVEVPAPTIPVAAPHPMEGAPEPPEEDLVN